jgi:hypothetical protein
MKPYAFLEALRAQGRASLCMLDLNEKQGVPAELAITKTLTPIAARARNGGEMH